MTTTKAKKNKVLAGDEISCSLHIYPLESTRGTFSLLLLPQQHTFVVAVLLLFPSHVIWRESFSEGASLQLAANDE